jgi:hypothetical protein
MTPVMPVCILCDSRMIFRTVPVWTGAELASHQLLICSQCGFGPDKAYETEAQALAHWQRMVEFYNKTAAECVEEATII